MEHTTIAVDLAKSVFGVAVSQRSGKVAESPALESIDPASEVRRLSPPETSEMFPAPSGVRASEPITEKKSSPPLPVICWAETVPVVNGKPVFTVVWGAGKNVGPVPVLVRPTSW